MMPSRSARHVLRPSARRAPSADTECGTPRHGAAARALGLFAVGALAPAVLLPARVVAQDLRYSLTPSAQQVTWNDALGLDNTLLYGGRFGVVFGRRIELQGHYLTNQGTDARISDLYDRLGISDRPPQNPGLDVRNVGASLVWNFSVGGFTPFVRAGGSVLRFEPEGARRTDRIALNYGGGLRFGRPGGLRFNIFAEDLRFRLDRTLLLPTPPVGGPVVVDPDAGKLRSNLVYGAGLSIPLGGGAVTYDDTPQYQLSNVALPVDVFAGRFDFASASGLPRQNVVGVRTGIDFGPLVGLRAFYFRGVNSGFDRAQGVQGYGGEAQFALNAGPGFNPFLLAGAGQIDFLDSYDRAPGVTTRDQTALILGGGVRVPLGSRFKLTATARNWLTAEQGRTQDVATRSQLRSNWQYGLGLSFGIGGRGNRRRVTSAPPTDTVFVDRRTGERLRASDRRRADEAMRRRESADAVEERRVVDRFVVTARGDTLRGASADSALAADRDARLVEVATARVRVDDEAEGRPLRIGPDGVERREGGEGYASDRTVSVVVPTEGEIIVRYGPPRGAPDAAASSGGSVDAVRAAVRDELAARGLGGGPQRTLTREYRDGGGRIVREYREPDNRLTREYQDGNRLVREWLDPATGRTRREYVPIPVPSASAPGATVVYPPAVQRAPALRYAPAAPGTTGAPAAEPMRGTTQASPGDVDVPRVVDGSGATVRKGAAPEDVAREDVGRAAFGRRVDGAPAPERASPDEVRAVVREELARAGQAGAAGPPAPIAPIADATQPSAVVVAPAQPAPGAVVVQSPVVYGAPRYDAGGGVQGYLLYSGATVAGGAQPLLGGRVDFGALTPRAPGFRLVPELAFGFTNGGTSTYVAANALYEFGPFLRVLPRVSLGAGLLNFNGAVGGRDGLDVVVTPSYGVSVPLRRFRVLGQRVPELVVEHQGPALYDLSRVVVGIGWRR